MIITISFLSGELRELEVPSSISCVYNVKAIMCDEFKELQEYEPQNIYLYDRDNKEMDRFDKVVDGEIYRALIVQDKRYVIDLDDEFTHVYCKNIDDDTDVRLLKDNEIKLIHETDNIEYFFNMKRFKKAWFQEENFFKRYGYVLRNINNKDTDSVYINPHPLPSDDDDEDNYRIEERTLNCLRYIFSGIRHLRIVYDVICTHKEL